MVIAGLGRAGGRIIVAALFHADVGKVDEVVVIGFKAGQHDVAQAAFARNTQFQIAGGFGFQVRVCFHGEVGMREVKPHFVGGGRAESGAPFGHHRPVGQEFPVDAQAVTGGAEFRRCVFQTGLPHGHDDFFAGQRAVVNPVVARTHGQAQGIAQLELVVPVHMPFSAFRFHKQLFRIERGRGHAGVVGAYPARVVVVFVGGFTPTQTVVHVPFPAAKVDAFFGARVYLLGSLHNAAQRVIYLRVHALLGKIVGQIPRHCAHLDVLAVVVQRQFVPQSAVGCVFVLHAGAFDVGNVVAVALGGKRATSEVGGKEIGQFFGFTVHAVIFIHPVQIMPLVEVVA